MSQDTTVAAPGLVICAKTRRLPTTEVDVYSEEDAFSLLSEYVADFPSSQDLGEAADLFEQMASWDGAEGPRPRLSIAAGAVALARKDLARKERTAEREQRRRRRDAEGLAAHLTEHGTFPDKPTPRREITQWSRKSRANMTRALCEIDFTMMMSTGRTPAMVTLTYPGDWLSVAPTGKACKLHLDEFRRRYRRAWGTDLEAVWKLEFQRRGAPHFHLLMVPPHGTNHGRVDAAGAQLAFRNWLSVVWADIVNHPDPIEYANHLAAGTAVDFAEGMRARDPKRTAVYFTKHGAYRAKEYQNVVPPEWRAPGQGPGRFWGYLHLDRVVYSVELPHHVAVQAARTMRRWARAQGTTRQLQARRVPGGRPVAATWDVIGLAGAQLVQATGAGRHRGVRRRVTRLRTGAGWLSVNNGAVFATQLARWLHRLRDTSAAAVHPLMRDRTGDA